MRLSTSLVALALTAASYATPVSSAKGFVRTSGQGFTLNGEPYTVFGSNAYWVGLMELSTTDMDTTFADIAVTGGTTVRTMGFNEVTKPSGDYYQLWNNSKPTVNYGPTGLANFDNVVASASKHNIRLIVTLTNNWEDYGGMDVYVNQIIGKGQPHDYFYTHPGVIAAFKNYVKAFVTRYRDEPTILGWELANEPRCEGGSGTTISGTCTTQTITHWAKTMSAYIKSIDSNHLVAVGDEGWMNNPTIADSSGSYNGSHGVDFNANLAIDTIDFGTFHLYPHLWENDTDPVEWGTEWIRHHRISQENYNKPVIMEEFGVTPGKNRTKTYEKWYSTVVDTGLTGVLIWQAGSNLTKGPSPDDGYAVFPGTPVYHMEQRYSAQLKTRNACNTA